jgi:FkbM family methyltransferase
MFSLRQIRLAAWSVLNLENWPEVIESRRKNKPLSSINMRNGVRLGLSADERQPFFEVFGEKVYDHPKLRVPKDGVVVDIGANIGIYTVYAALNLVPQGRVFAFEPTQQCASAIERNCRDNRIGNVSVVNKGIAKVDGMVPFNIAERSSDSSMFSISSGKRIESVEVLSPISLFGMFSRIDLMKLDCEGAEFILLWEAERSDWEKVRAITLEYHLGLQTGYPDGNVEAITGRLVDLGFRILSSEPTKNPQFGYIIARRDQ